MIWDRLLNFSLIITLWVLGMHIIEIYDLNIHTIKAYYLELGHLSLKPVLVVSNLGWEINH